MIVYKCVLFSFKNLICTRRNIHTHTNIHIDIGNCHVQEEQRSEVRGQTSYCSSSWLRSRRSRALTSSWGLKVIWVDPPPRSSIPTVGESATPRPPGGGRGEGGGRLQIMEYD